MSNRKTKILGLVAIILTVTVTSIHFAHADVGDIVGSLLGFKSAAALINYFLASLANTALMIASWILAFAGLLLNLAMRLTLNIKQVVDNTTAIYTTWKAIRDISGLFFIFFLLYASILLIINEGAGKFSGYLKSIVIAGILINFSFFFAELGIDASNIVSMQLYNAIAPANTIGLKPGDVSNTVSSTIGDGGISDIFMNSLKIQTLYDVQQNNGTKFSQGDPSFTDSVRIILTAVIGVLIEIAAAFSFGIAAIAFVLRFVILIFLLAFSPVMFLGFLPEVGKYVGKWKDAYKSMLIFMPVYLLLMYLAMNVLATSKLFTPGNNPALLPSTDPHWYVPYLTLGINAAIVLFLLNIPLVAAATVASAGGLDFLDKANKKYGVGAIFGRVGATTQKWAYQGTVGRVASKVASSEAFKDLAAKSRVGAIALQGTRTAAAGYDATLKKQIEDKTKFAESLGVNQIKLTAANQKLREANAEVKRREQEVKEAKAAKVRPDLLAFKEQNLTDAREAQKNARRDVGAVKNERTEWSAKKTGGSSLDTLYLYKARKNKAAAAKIHIDAWENLLKDKKEDMKTIDADIKTLKNQINAMPDAKATEPQQKSMDDLNERKTKTQEEIDDLSEKIDNAKLIK